MDKYNHLSVIPCYDQNAIEKNSTSQTFRHQGNATKLGEMTSRIGIISKQVDKTFPPTVGVLFGINDDDAGKIICSTSNVSPNDHNSISNYEEEYDFINGTNLNCLAMNNVGFKFGKWSGLSSSTTNLTKISLYHNGALIAHFKQDPLEIYTQPLYPLFSPLYLLPLMAGVLISFIPYALIKWYKKKYNKDKDEYVHMIEEAFDENSKKSLERLYELDEKFIELYIKGRMSFSLYQEINNKILEYISKARTTQET